MSSTYHYFTKLREEIGGFTITIERIDENFECAEILLVFNDRDVFTELPRNLGNYYSWSGAEIKKYIKEYIQQIGVDAVLCTWSSSKSNRHATLVMDCYSDLALDAPVYQ